jgi:hypothetical protein
VATKKKAGKRTTAAGDGEGGRAKFPRHSVSKSLRIAKAILEQNAGKPCTPSEAAAFVGVGKGGLFKENGVRPLFHR